MTDLERIKLESEISRLTISNKGLELERDHYKKSYDFMVKVYNELVESLIVKEMGTTAKTTRKELMM